MKAFYLLFVLLIAKYCVAQEVIVPNYHFRYFDKKYDTSTAYIDVPSDSLYGIVYLRVITDDAVILPDIKDSIDRQNKLKKDAGYVDTLIGRGYKMSSDYWLLSLICYDISDYYNSIQAANYSIELDSTYFPSFRQRAESKQVLKDYTGAIQDYNKAVYKCKKYMYAALSLANVYVDRGRCKAAYATINAHNPNNELLLEALSDINTAIALNDKIEEPNGFYYYLKGIILFEMKEKGNALEWLSKSGEAGYKGAYQLINEINSTN